MSNYDTAYLRSSTLKSREHNLLSVTLTQQPTAIPHEHARTTDIAIPTGAPVTHPNSNGTPQILSASVQHNSSETRSRRGNTYQGTQNGRRSRAPTARLANRIEAPQRSGFGQRTFAIGPSGCLDGRTSRAVPSSGLARLGCGVVEIAIGGRVGDRGIEWVRGIWCLVWDMVCAWYGTVWYG